MRFLLLVIGGWIGARALTLWPAGVEAAELVAEIAPGIVREAEALVGTDSPQAAPPLRMAGAAPEPSPSRLPFALLRTPLPPLAPAGPAPVSPEAPPARAVTTAPAVVPSPRAATIAQGLFAAARTSSPAFVSPPAPGRSRWAGSAWLFVRDELSGGALAPGGALGGSQAGARLTYRVNNDPRRPLSLSARLDTPLADLRGAEAAFGIDWRPIARFPINILAERRQAIGPDGRSDFALMLHGGGETRVANGRFRIEGYGQAGIVGIEARDLFADGGVTATTRIGPIDFGGGAWGGAQPGASRLDLGPHASFRLPIGRASLRAAAEWRFRVAGDAAPDSGPTLTISAGF